MNWQYDASLLRMQDLGENHYMDMQEKLKTVRKRLSNDHTKILFCLNELGLVCAYEVWICSVNELSYKRTNSSKISR